MNFAIMDLLGFIKKKAVRRKLIYSSPAFSSCLAGLHILSSMKPANIIKAIGMEKFNTWTTVIGLITSNSKNISNIEYIYILFTLYSIC